jgi:hypothetical protein
MCKFHLIVFIFKVRRHAVSVLQTKAFLSISVELHTVEDLMDAVGRVLCESEHEKGPHKLILFVNPSVDKYAVNAAALSLWPVVALLLTTGN